MNWKEGLAILASLTAVLGFGITMLDRMVTTDEGISQVTVPPHHSQKIVILARTTFNESGRVYAEGFDGEIVQLNNSFQVVYLA